MSPRRRDQLIYDYVATHYDPEFLNNTGVEKVATVLGMEPYDVRCIAFQSDRLRLRAVLLGWHIIELMPQAQAAEAAVEITESTP